MSELSRPIHKVADILSRRGQTIYGREVIVDLCAKSGVSLMDSFASDMGEEDSEASLLVFVVVPVNSHLARHADVVGPHDTLRLADVQQVTRMNV